MDTVCLGSTGIEVSRLCFGTLTVGPLQAALPVEEGAGVLAHAIHRGVNFCDTAQLYGTYPVIRRAMELTGAYNLVICSKTYAYTKELAVEAVEQARRELNRDYIDVFLLHEQESIHTLRGHREALETLYGYKAKGIIRAVGASMHCVAAVHGVAEMGLDVIHPLLNLTGLGIQDGSREEMVAAVQNAHSRGIGVFSMKSLGGGNLFRRAQECFSFALGADFVDSVAVGMQSAEEVDANVAFFETGSFPHAARRVVEAKTRRLHIEEWCTGCGQCVRRCGQKALALRDSRAVCRHEACVLCGYCATVCPDWSIKVI